jgi:hypothetical protein
LVTRTVTRRRGSNPATHKKQSGVTALTWLQADPDHAHAADEPKSKIEPSGALVI